MFCCIYHNIAVLCFRSCTDLSDNDIEISIIRGVNYSKDADTYVMFEFPYPSDSPPSDRTTTVKGTCNPEYQAVFPLTGIIDRSFVQTMSTSIQKTCIEMPSMGKRVIKKCTYLNNYSL